MTAAAQPREEFEVWINHTVFVRKTGDKRPWSKHIIGEHHTVQTANQDKAMYLGEREMARRMAQRFHLVKAPS